MEELTFGIIAKKLFEEFGKRNYINDEVHGVNLSIDTSSKDFLNVTLYVCVSPNERSTVTAQGYGEEECERPITKDKEIKVKKEVHFWSFNINHKDRWENILNDIINSFDFKIKELTMQIILDIPKEFEEHFNMDRFEDSLERVCTSIQHDRYTISGRYEFEVIEMLKKALLKAKIV